MEVTRRVRRHVAADRRDAEQLAAPRFVRCLAGQPLGQVGVALGEPDRRVARDVHRLQRLVLPRRVRIRPPIEARAPLRDLRSVVEHALAVDLAVERGVPGRALLHELGEHARLVGRAPAVGHVGEHAVAHGPAAPVRDDLRLVRGDRLRVRAVARLLALVQRAQVLHRMAGQLGEGGHHFGRGPALAHDHLVRADPDRLLLAEIAEAERPQHRHRMPALVLPVEPRHPKRTLRRHRGLRLEAPLHQPRHSLVHASASDRDREPVAVQARGPVPDPAVRQFLVGFQQPRHAELAVLVPRRSMER